MYWNIFIPLQIEVRQTSSLRKLKNEFSIFKSPNRDLTICDTRRHLSNSNKAWLRSVCTSIADWIYLLRPTVNDIQTIQNKISDTSGEIVMYQPDETIRLEVRLGEDTVWLICSHQLISDSPYQVRFLLYIDGCPFL